MNSRSGLAIFATVVVLGASCADVDRGDPKPDAAVPWSPPILVDAGADTPTGGAVIDAQGSDTPPLTSVSFASDVRPLLEDACARCHGAGGEAADSAFVMGDDAMSDYQQAVNLIDPANPAGSRFVRKAAGQGHGGGAVFPSGSLGYQTLLNWITQGTAP